MKKEKKMLNIKNMNPTNFKKYIYEKNVFIFGAGRALDSCLDIYFKDNKVNKIVDNNSSLWGNYVENGLDKIEIINKERFVAEVKRLGVSNTVLLITSPFYAAEIVEDLDKYSELDGLECFLQVIIRNTFEEILPYTFTSGKSIIPKKIHYIWIGKKELPVQFVKNIETWKIYNPDYEIIRWDETNYDFNKCAYLREAYENQAWGFATNYARLDIIHKYGGIYLDTDVEVIHNLDVLLKDKAFFNMGCSERVNNGCGFGAVKNCSIVRDIMSEYEQAHFISQSGKLIKKQAHIYLNRVLKQYGFNIVNQYQNINGIVLYPSEVMSPLTIEGMSNMFSDKTLSIHKEEGSWKSEEQKKGYIKLQKIINDRITDSYSCKKGNCND